MSEFYDAGQGNANKEFPCINQLTDEDPCPNFVFFSHTVCVDCRVRDPTMHRHISESKQSLIKIQRAGRVGTEERVELSEINDELVDSLVNSILERMELDPRELELYLAAG